MNRALPLLALAMLAGCAHKARHFDAPDASALEAKQGEVVAHAGKARAAVARASQANMRAKTAHTAATHASGLESAEIAIVTEKLNDPRFQNAPPELRKLVDDARADVETLKATHAELVENLAATGAAVAEERAAHAEAAGELEKTNAAANEINTSLGPEYVAKVGELTAHANTSEQQLATASKSLWWYRGHMLLCSALALAAVVVGVLAWLGKLGGKAAVVAAEVAAKIP